MQGRYEREICHIMARLVDAVEIISRRLPLEESDLTRLRNIRHDSVTLLNRLR